jgi:biofilm PGA synthesis N-glycosyltransferase PgaC
MLELIALVTGGFHFGVPLVYYRYLRNKTKSPWGFRLTRDYITRVTVLVPTFDEATLIERKLDNVKAQSYPKRDLDVIVVDSASTDATVQLAVKWASRNPELDVKIVTESSRMGKAHALNTGLQQTDNDIVVTTDADSRWTEESLREVIRYFSDESVGAVTGLKNPENIEAPEIETTYRSFYNFVRVAESRIHSTPIFNGELAAFRRDSLEKLGGFKTDIGADDSHTATLLAISGLRSIAIPEAFTFELAPSSWSGYFKWKRRRALHLVQHFVKSLSKLPKAPRKFRIVLAAEAYLNIFNPWLLLLSVTAFLVSIAVNGPSLMHLGVIGFLVSTQIFKSSRAMLKAWLIDQFLLIFGSLSGLISSEIVWTKIKEVRR